MAKSFNLTAQINLRGPTNLRPIVADIKRQLGNINADVNIKLSSQAAKSVSAVASKLKSMNDILVTAKNNTDSLSASLSRLSSSLSGIGNAGSKTTTAITKTASSAKTAAQNIKQATTEMEAFGKQSALAIRRFAAFSVVSGAIYKLVNAINSGFAAFVSFDKQLVKLQQVTGKGAMGLKALENQITSLATSLGVSSESLIEVASTLAQAGLNAEETRIALAALAKTELAPSFDSLTETTEGAIAALRQFELSAGDLEAALGSINAVAAAFAVESSDIITAIQRTGGVFAAASKGVSQGKDALNEFIAVFTSVRATTRESAETIATGLRTIFTRIQRGKTIEQLKDFGIILTDLEGKFVGPFEAIKRLSEGLKTLDPRDLRFSQIVEELGGFRQIGKVIPLIQQFAEAQKALKVAQAGQSSLTDAQLTAQKSLANQIAKVREQFLALIRDVGKSNTFKAITSIVLNLASAFISLASAFKPILPFLAILGAIKGIKAIGEFGTGFFGGLKSSTGGSTAKNIGSNIGSTISGSKEQEKAATTKLATDAIQSNTSALKSLTTAVSALENTIKSRGSATLSSGGKILGFNSGGIVPGSGKGDKVPAMLEPGEVVINNKAANKYGRGNLARMNRYAKGGIAKAVVSRVVDGDTLNVDITPTSDTFNTSATRLFGYDAYEVNKGTDREKKLGAKAKGLAEQYYPAGKDVTDIFTRKYLSSVKRDKYGRYFYGDNQFGKKLVDLGLGIPYSGSGPRATKETESKRFGGMIQKFMAGSRGGINVPSGKGRGLKRSKGARAPEYDIPNAENFVEWAKNIYSEYDDDPSLPTASYMGLSMPVEIAYANMLLAEFLKRGGSGLSTGKKFIVTPPDKIDDAIRPYLVPNPNNPNQLGFFGDAEILAFQRANKTELELREDQKRIDELSKRKTTSEMQRELFGFGLEGVAKSVRDKTLTKEQLETLSPDVLAALAADPKAQVFSLPKLKAETAPASSTLLESIGGALSEFRKSGGQTNLSGVIPPEAAKQIKDAIPSYIDSIKDEPQKVTKAKTALKYFDTFINGGTAEKPAHATHFVETINQILKNGMVQRFPNGGKVSPQQLIAGPYPRGITTEGRTWKEIIDPYIKSTGLPYDGRYFTIGRQLLSLRDSLTPSKLTSGNFKQKVGEDTVKKLENFRKSVLEAYNTGKKKVDEEDVFNLTPKEIAEAKDIAVVGFRTDLKDLDPYYRKRKGIPLRVHTGILKGEDYKDVEGLWERYYNDQIATAASIAARRGQKPTQISETERKTFGIANAQGYDVEVILAALGSKGGKKTANDAVDFSGGLSNLAATVFNVPPNIPSQAKLTINSSSILDSIDGIIKTFAFGGKTDGADFEAIKKQKNFGKIGLRNNGSEITATYFKNTEREGFVSAKKASGNLYTIGLSNASKGYGPRLYDIVMEAATASGGMLTSDRNQVSDAAQAVWKYYFNNRSDVKKTPLDPSQWTKNQSYIDPKLYGKKDTWPPPNDPAWILQSGYSKSPDLINKPDIIDMNDPKYANFIQQQQLGFISRNNGGNIGKFASGGTIPAMVSAGEAFVPPKLAKKIGYAKLDQMNQADRNGTKGFASGGGISVFKGPGSGTSDSIGPVGLPAGGYVIREKATKALGLNKGGSIGTVTRFATGGTTSGLSTNMIANFEAVADQMGVSLYELAQIIQDTAAKTKEAALAEGKSMEEAAAAAKDAAAALLGLDKLLSPGENPLGGGPDYGSSKQKNRMATQAAKAAGTIITNVETNRAERQRRLAPEGVVTRNPGDEAAANSAKGFSRKDVIASMSGDTGAGVENIINTYNEITNKIAEAEARVKELSNQQIDIKNSGGDSTEIDTKLASAQTEAESLRSTRTSKAAMAGAGQGVETDVGLNIVEYIANFEKLNQAISDGVAEVEKAKKQEEQAYENEAAAKNKVIQERMKSIKGGSLSDRYATAKEAVESGDYDRSSEAAQRLDKAKTNRQQSAKDRYSAEQSLEVIQKQKTKTYGRSSSIEDSLESTRRLAGGGDPFYEAKKAADFQKEQAKTSPFGMGPESPDAKKRKEQQYADEEFFKYKASQTGTSEAGVKLDLAQKLGKASNEAKSFFGGKVSETQTGLVTRRESALKIGASIEKAKKAQEDALKSGDQEALKAATQQLADANSRLSQETEAILQQMIELRPDLAATDKGMGQLSAAAGKAAEDLSKGDLAAAQSKLGKAVAGTEEGGGLSESEAAAVARFRVSRETGVDSGLLERQFGVGGASAKMAKQQAFIQSREGQRFGRFAEFAPGLAQGISETGVGKALGGAGDFISGKGGKYSKLFAGVGGFQGIGSGLAVGSEALKNSGLISKDTLKNSNVAGAFGAVQGAGVGAASGAELGNQLGGAPGALIGAIGGAIIGGIKGFFDAKNAQVLQNALDKLTKSSEAVDIAFKELAKNDTDKNFKNVQKAFGQQIEASKELESIAFSDGSSDAMSGLAGGAIAGAGLGAAGGALVGSFVPIIGNAVGAAIGGVLGGIAGGITGYLSAQQSKANKEEAVKGRIGVAGAMNEGAARMAERQMGRMTTEQLTQVGTGGTNVIADQYKQSAIAAAEAADSEKKLTSRQKEKIGQNAIDSAYLDAYMKQRKEAGATDQQITDDILKDRNTALQAGKEALDSQEQAAKKQQLLARATKEVALATENLLDVYRRVGANAQRFSDEIDDMLGNTKATTSSLRGNATLRDVDRSGSERVLGNMAAYSTEEVRAATQEMVGKLGGGEEAQALGKQAEAAKFLQDKLPGMLRNENADPKQIMSDIRDEMKDMGIGGGAVDKMLSEIEKQISDSQKGGLGTLADEISAGGIDKFSMTAAEAAKTLQNLSKTYNDTLQKSIDLQNAYNESIMQSNSFLRKAGTIRLNAELDLSKALGNSPTLAQLNEPFDFEIKDLTKGLVAGGTTDPAQIAAGIVAKTEENKKLEEAKKAIGNEGMQGVSAADQGAELLAKNQELGSAIGSNVVAINEGRQALEKLANDGSKAANALAKIEEQQRQIEGLGNRFEKIFTSSPEELFKMNKQSAALEAAQQGGSELFKSRAFRQDAFAGLEQDKEFLSPEEYRKQRGTLMRKSFEAQGYTGESMVQKGGIQMTLDELIKRIEGGMPSEEDPNVKAYREAVSTQVAANKELAKLEEIASLGIQESMLGLQDFLAKEFPKILTDAVTASKADAETKPELKPETRKGEQDKVEAEKQREDANKKKTELDAKIKVKESELKTKKEEWTFGPGAGKAVEVKQRENELKTLRAKRNEQARLEATASEKSKAADATIAEENKVREENKAAQAAAEKKTKEDKLSSSMQTANAALPQGQQSPQPSNALADREAKRKAIATRKAELEAQPAVQPTTVATPTETAKAAQQAQPAAQVKATSAEPPKTDLKARRAAEYKRIRELGAKVGRKYTGSTELDKIREEEQAAKKAEKTQKREDYLLKQDPRTRQRLMTKAEKEAGLGEKLAQREAEMAAKTEQTTSSAPVPAPTPPGAAAQSPQDKAKTEKAMTTGSLPATQATTPQDKLSLSMDTLTQSIDRLVAIYSQQTGVPQAPTVATNGPIPVTKPLTPETTTPLTPAGSTATTAGETTGTMITIDPASLEGLASFNKTFGEYVNQLVSFSFPPIEGKVDINHKLEVNMTGAASIASLDKHLQDLAVKMITPKLQELESEIKKSIPSFRTSDTRGTKQNT